MKVVAAEEVANEGDDGEGSCGRMRRRRRKL